MISKLFIGDVSQDLANHAKCIDSTAFLITEENFTVDAPAAYTSLGDLGIINFLHILENASEIYYVPPTKWSDGRLVTDTGSLGWHTVNHLRIVKNQGINVHNFTNVIPSYVHAPFVRQSPDPQLWVFGCSTSAGYSVDQKQSYAYLLSKKLNMSVTNKSIVASCNLFQSHLMCQSDIQKDDIVVFGITAKARATQLIDGRIVHVTANRYTQNPNINDYVPLKYLDSEQRLYESIYAVQIAQNFCKRVGAKLVLLGIHADLDISSLLSYYNNYVIIHGKQGYEWHSSFLDFGSDGDHAGPLTHKLYADLAYEKIISLGYINGEKNVKILS